MIEPGFYYSPPAFLKNLFFPFDRAMAKMFYSRFGREKSFVGSYYNTSLVTPEMIDELLITRHTPGAVEAMQAMGNDPAAYTTYEDIAAAVPGPRSRAARSGKRHDADPRRRPDGRGGRVAQGAGCV